MVHRLRRWPVLRHLLIRPRLASSIACGWLVSLIVPLHPEARLLVGFDAGVVLYLILAGVMMTRAGVSHMEHRAAIQDDGRWAILTLVVLASAASLGGIVAHLAVAKDIHGPTRAGHIALALMTILLSWAFTQVMFALHYAHHWYLRRGGARQGGIEIPGTAEPGYVDFLYVACVIGTSGQTADCTFTTPTLRRVALIHCVQAFFFNAALLGLGINIAASLLAG